MEKIYSIVFLKKKITESSISSDWPNNVCVALIRQNLYHSPRYFPKITIDYWIMHTYRNYNLDTNKIPFRLDFYILLQPNGRPIKLYCFCSHNETQHSDIFSNICMEMKFVFFRLICHKRKSHTNNKCSIHLWVFFFLLVKWQMLLKKCAYSRNWHFEFMLWGKRGKNTTLS